MSTKPLQYKLPTLFKVITSKHNTAVKHFIALREKKQYRVEQQRVMVQGFKTIKELYERGLTFKSLTVTTKGTPTVEADIHYPAIQILKHPEMFPAEKYYVADVDIARRVLGTSSKPGTHDIFAEVVIPTTPLQGLASKNRLLVFDQINDPGNLGGLIRTASALGWDSGLVTHGSGDLYNDKTIRASRALSLSWQHNIIGKKELLEYLREHGFTPIVADMLPKNKETCWSPEYGSDMTTIQPGTGLWFWNFKNQPKVLPEKMALILSSEHNGVKELNDEIRVSTPMQSSVESLNVAVAGSIIMNELNRYNLNKSAFHL